MTAVYSRPSYLKARNFTTGQRPMGVLANAQNRLTLAERLPLDARAADPRTRPRRWP